jgi:beta-galactosidase
MENLDKLEYSNTTDTATPVFLKGEFNIDDPCDTFIRLDGFHNGFVCINGFNIGRYKNDRGPQKTLYIPAPVLKKGVNEIVVFETDGFDAPTVMLTDTPDLG